MKKVISIAWPFLHAWLGFLVVGALGRSLFAFRLPFRTDALMHGPTPYTNSWPTEYAFIMMLACIPGVLYAAAVAAASKSRRMATVIISSAYALVAVAIICTALYNRSRGVSFLPSLAPLGAVATLGRMFIIGLCVSLLMTGLSRRRRLLIAAFLILLSFSAIALTPRGMIAWHKASLRKIRPGLLSLDPQGDEHYLLRVRHAEDKHALVQLGYLKKLEYIPEPDYGTNELDALFDELFDIVRTNSVADVGGFIPVSTNEQALVTIWDRRDRVEFWDAFAEKRNLRKTSPTR